MTEEIKEAHYRFEDFDDGSVLVTHISENGTAPFEVTLTNVTWGMLEDIMNVQEKSADDPRAIFAFLNEHVEGGTSSIPLKYTLTFFEAISEYMNQVMSIQKK